MSLTSNVSIAEASETGTAFRASEPPSPPSLNRSPALAIVPRPAQPTHQAARPRTDFPGAFLWAAASYSEPLLRYSEQMYQYIEPLYRYSERMYQYSEQLPDAQPVGSSLTRRPGLC